MLSQRGFKTRQAQGHKVGRNRIIIDTKFGKGDKVRTRAKSKLFLLGLWIGDGEIFQLSMDNHLPLEQITADFDEKRRWFDSKVRYQWFNNIVASRLDEFVRFCVIWRKTK